MIIKVTREHIDKGQAEEGDSCAVALAIQEQVPGIDRNSIEVDGTTAFFTIGPQSFKKVLPEFVWHFITDFDHNCDIAIGDGDYARDTSHLQPFEFELDVAIPPCGAD